VRHVVVLLTRAALNLFFLGEELLESFVATGSGQRCRHRWRDGWDRFTARPGLDLFVVRTGLAQLRPATPATSGDDAAGTALT
jgi:hypothetical protein